MDLMSIVGIVLGWGVILIGIIVEGISPMDVLKLAPFLIVFGGTVFATLIAYDWPTVARVPKYLRSFLTKAERPKAEHVMKFYEFSNTARKEGILSLEDAVNSPEHQLDEFTAKGLQLVIDGVEPDTVQDVLEEDLKSQREYEEAGAEIFEMAGGYSPTIGIIGTVMGMMFALKQLGAADEATIGYLIASALTATFYGLFFANLLWLPIGAKIKFRMNGLAKYRMLTIKGLLQIQSGANPRIVVEQLNVYLEEEAERQKVKNMITERG